MVLLKIKDFLNRQFEVTKRQDLAIGGKNKIVEVLRIKDDKVFDYFDFIIDHTHVLKKIYKGKNVEVEVWVCIENFEEDCIHVHLHAGVDSINGLWRFCWHEEIVEINEIEEVANEIVKDMLSDYKSLKECIAECKFKEENNIFE